MQKNGKPNLPSAVVIPGPKKAQAEDAKIDELIQQMIKGEVVHDDPTIQYFAAKLRETVIKGQNAAQVVDRLKGQLQAAEDEALRMGGAATEYSKDLKHWLKKSLKEQSSGQEQPKEEALPTPQAPEEDKGQEAS